MDITSFTSGLESRDGIYFSPNQKAISYPEEGNDVFFNIEENSFWFRHRNEVIANTVKRHSHQGLFFDIGGGNGYVSKGIENAGFTTFLVEPGLQGCVNARKRGLKHVVCSTLETAGFRNASLPNIGLFDVVEHIEDDVNFLKMIHSYLEPNGLAYITVPAYQLLWSNEDVDAGHFRRYTIAGLEKKLKALGFAVEYSTYIFSILPLPIFLSRSLPSKFGLNKNSNDPEKHQNEHQPKKGIVDKAANWFWRREMKQVNNGKKVPLGSSCFIVAKKLP